MNEFIEKLIGRLEERIKLHNKKAQGYANKALPTLAIDTLAKREEVKEIMNIVNELAEEHNERTIINEQYCWQTCGATEHCKECNRLCNGSIDYYENYDC